MSPLRQDLTGFDDGATLKALHGRAPPSPARLPQRATASQPEPEPFPSAARSADAPPFPPCLSSPPDFAGRGKRVGWAALVGVGAGAGAARRPAARSAEAPAPARWAGAGRPASLQGDFDGFCVQPLDEARLALRVRVG